MTKLWHFSGAKSDEFVDEFTVGDDHLLDLRLLPYEIAGSMAHAEMLAEMGIIAPNEKDTLQKNLDEILTLWEKGKFEVYRQHEDVHTAVENFLTEKCGDIGKKLHTGRSRNDLALLAIRLYLKEKTVFLIKEFDEMRTAFAESTQKYSDVEMPGFTHMQRAMPTTVGAWFGAFSDAFSDQKPFLNALPNLLNQNPLGSASGFGIRNFPMRREITTKQLGFAKTQENPIYCGLSRGLFEANFCESFSGTILILSRFIADIFFFTANGNHFFDIPDFLTTGSSIMPQKRNFDPAEIFRGKLRVFLAIKNEIEVLQVGLLSGYNRDISLVKAPIFRAVEILEKILKMAQILTKNIVPNRENLRLAMTADLFATEKVYELVADGIPFREAYATTKEKIFEQKKKPTV